MSDATATGAAMILAPLVAGMRGLGLDPATLLAPHGLTEAGLTDPLARFDNATILALWDEAPAAAGDDNFGFVAATHSAPGMFHVLDYLVSTAPTLGDGLARASEHGRLLHDLLRVELRLDGPEATLVQQPGTKMPVPRAQGDFFMAATVMLARRLTGRDGAPLAVTLRHSAPLDPAPGRKLLRCPVIYGAPENSVVFPSAMLGLPSVDADPTLADVVSSHAALLLADLPVDAPLIVRVRRHIGGGLDAPASAADTARALGMSERTLRRKLDALGTSFHHLQAQMRVEAALRLLRDESLGLDGIAADVGLSGARALTRLLRRSTGRTPTELRAELQGRAEHAAE